MADMSSERIKIPEQSTAYILFQRTALLKWFRWKIVKAADRLLGGRVYSRLVAYEARTRTAEIEQAYVQDIASELALIRPYLPAAPRTIVDIGCGIAAIDAMLFHHYDRPTNLTFILVDRSQVEEKVHYGFQSRGAFYNSLEAAKNCLVLNGVPEHNVVLKEAGDSIQIAPEGSVDLVISIISWGFHYPVDTYLTEVLRILKPGGSLILDVRRNTGGLELLHDHFDTVSEVAGASSDRKVRVCATKAS
jgi:SAM-dependent methyltransferase